MSDSISSNALPTSASSLNASNHSEEIHYISLLSVLLLGMFIAILNQTLINVAIPHMMIDFNVSANTIQWLVTGFMLANGVLIPISAFLMESFGTRPLFILAMGSFTLGSLICGISPNFGIMLCGRIVQAVGAGILMPLVMNIFLTIFPPEKRGTAMGTMGIAMIFAPAIGPTLSGWIVENYTWRILFFIMLPLGLIDIVLAFNWMKNVTKLTHPKFDLWGAIMSTLGFGSLLFGFSEAGNKGWESFVVLGSIGIGLFFLILFVFRELTVNEPILELRVFRYDIFTLTTIISSIINMALFAAMLLLPIYLQNIRGFTPLQSGLLLLPGALIMGVMSPIAGRMFDRFGLRPLAITGLLITTVTTYEFSKLSSETTYEHILWIYCIRSFGMSLLMMTVMTAGLNQLPRRLNSHGTAMSNTMRQVAGAIGTAFLVTVMSTRSNVHMANYENLVTSANPYITEQLAQISVLFGSNPQTTTMLVYGEAMKQSAINGINDAFIVATIITSVALFLSFFVRRANASEDPSSREK